MSNANEPAFPARLDNVHPDYAAMPGLTKREYFAGLVMQGLCADPSNHQLFRSHRHAAKSAVQIADALLSELERTS